MISDMDSGKAHKVSLSFSVRCCDQTEHWILGQNDLRQAVRPDTVAIECFGVTTSHAAPLFGLLVADHTPRQVHLQLLPRYETLTYAVARLRARPYLRYRLGHRSRCTVDG
jgi:hypothetical protein